MTQLTDPSDIFRQEAVEILDQLEGVLLDLERAPGDRALLDAAFRAMHTLKGSGAMFGYDRVAAFMHGFEATFDRIRKGEIPASREILAASLEARDHVRCLIESPDEPQEARGTAILARLEGSPAAPTQVCVDSVDSAAPVEIPAAPAEDLRRIRFWFKGPVLANGTDPLRLVDELRGLGARTVRGLLDRLPSLADLDPDVCYLGWEVALPTSVSIEEIEQVFVFVLDDLDLEIDEGLSTTTSADGTTQPAIAPAMPEAVAPANASGGGPSVRPPSAPEAAEPVRPHVVTETVRVQAERLDDLMDRVGELVIQQARLAQLAEAHGEALLKTVAEDIGRLAAGLRDTTMNIRLVPIGSLFNRFRRLIRDLSQELGKPIELVTDGEETELDKTVIERLADPLIHIIRNALDHGIEPPDLRIVSGKPAVGHLHLSARHVGAEVQITIKDDGRGLDRARIRQKAEESGLTHPGAVLADNELLRLILEPGFSTAKQVSALSGRGVGMDVVKRAVEALRGGIELASVPGEGTDIMLRLPLTLAIIEGLLVELADVRYVIPLAAVQECVELPDDTNNGRNLLDIRGELIPFVRLRDLFSAEHSDAPHQKVVIVSSGEMQVGLVVDRIIGSHQTVIKSLSRLHTDVKTFSGATILADGSAALILDIPQLIDRAQLKSRRQAHLDQEAA